VTMHFLALASDYDGTLAYSGTVRDSTIAALEKLKDSGRTLLLVTGRQLNELLDVFPRADLFEWIVAENGALLYCPLTRESKLLAEPMPDSLPALLRERGIQNFATGQSILGTWRPNECTVLTALADLGLDRQIIFNKDAVMVLPTGVNKASGLSAALRELRLSPHNVVAVGDAENDLPMLTFAGCGVAVDNALDSVKAKSDLVMSKGHGEGVEELIASLLQDDLAQSFGPQQRKSVVLGRAKDDEAHRVFLPGLGSSTLVAGPSGGGKSTSITGVLERLAAYGYQLCILDPEGDYEVFDPAVSLGNPHYAPSAEEVLTLLERMHNAVVNLLGVSLDARPEVCSELLRKCEGLLTRKGRPHWFIVDEAHHIFPTDRPAGNSTLTHAPRSNLLITVHPEHLHKDTLEAVDVLLAVGKSPEETIRHFCEAIGIDAPQLTPIELQHGEVLAWYRRGDQLPFVVITEAGKTEHRRHVRKYAEGDLGVGSFVFTGPEGKLRLSAQNLNTFMRMAEGIDDATWCYHLNAGHLSEWFRWIVKNRELADEVCGIEKEDASAADSKHRVFEAIKARYTAAA
jgi:hydroxymethylpyrimidine pyrophosphatase-like HAD family hydrolase